MNAISQFAVKLTIIITIFFLLFDNILQLKIYFGFIDLV